MRGFLADVSDLIPPTVMAILFVSLVVTILRVQNPRRRAASKLREEDAERADPRILADQQPLWQAAKSARKATGSKPSNPARSPTRTPTRTPATPSTLPAPSDARRSPPGGS